MSVKRAAELKLLEDQYASSGNNLVILYGRKGMGKTTLLTQFLEDKPAVYYYEGMECEDKLQRLLMNQRLMPDINDEQVLDYPHLFFDLINQHQEKSVIILDEFHYILKNSPTFTQVFSLLTEQVTRVMFVLCSSSIRWVENEMVAALGHYAAYISAYLKLKEFTFVDFINHFPKSSVETCIYIKGILGGIPEYLEEWQENQSVEDNITNKLMDKNSRLFMAPQQYLKLELREPAVYNTILSALAEGNRKLNDLHKKTGYSRAKISVYLKYLIQQDIVEKLVPLGEEGKENVQKGLYRIKDNFLSFWYRFIFPNLSELMLGRKTVVYQHKVVPFLYDYMGEYFADVCTEYLKLMNQHQRLPLLIQWWDRWYGKNGTIDIQARSPNGENLLGKCLWTVRQAEISDYEHLQSLATEAGVQPALYYLFSKSGFSKELRQLAESMDRLTLVGLEDL